MHLLADVRVCAGARADGSYSGADVQGAEEQAYEVGTKATARSWDYSRSRVDGGNAAALFVPGLPHVLRMVCSYSRDRPPIPYQAYHMLSLPRSSLLPRPASVRL